MHTFLFHLFQPYRQSRRRSGMQWLPPPLRPAAALPDTRRPCRLRKCKDSVLAVIAQPRDLTHVTQELGLGDLPDIAEARARPRKLLPRKGEDKKGTSEAKMALEARLRKLKGDPACENFVLQDINARSGKLYCRPCCTYLTNNKHVIIRHLQSDKHSNGQTLEKSRMAERLQLIQIVKGWRELNPKAPFKKLEDDELLYRVGTLRDWTKAGLPYSALKGDIKAAWKKGTSALDLKITTASSSPS